ncbi:MAG TPA: glycosyltransferase [Candidatus Pelethosoma merdigallinarum]|nr:glycosyltransferase [Candidatus Pelethosoma merdigallinarum]
MNKYPRVLHLLASNKFSGAENVACTIMSHYPGEAFYCSPRGPIEETVKEKGLSYLPLPKFTPSALKKIVKQNHIDVIHAHDFKCSMLASFLAPQVKVVSHLHCNPTFIKSWNIYSLAYRSICHKFTKVIVVSNEILEGTVFYPAIKDRVLVLNNVVDPTMIQKRSEECKQEIPQSDLIFVGRLIPLKQPLFFIDMVKKIREKQDIHATIVGDGELYDACIKKIQEEHLESVIHVVGFQENPFPYIKASKVAVLPSTTEGLPMSVIECMILDVPVVNSGVGGLSKMFSKHPEYLCHTLEEYVSCIEKLLQEPHEKIHEVCQDVIEPYVNISDYMEQIVHSYQ